MGHENLMWKVCQLLNEYIQQLLEEVEQDIIFLGQIIDLENTYKHNILR